MLGLPSLTFPVIFVRGAFVGGSDELKVAVAGGTFAAALEAPAVAFSAGEVQRCELVPGVVVCCSLFVVYRSLFVPRSSFLVADLALALSTKTTPKSSPSARARRCLLLPERAEMDHLPAQLGRARGTRPPTALVNTHDLFFRPAVFSVVVGLIADRGSFSVAAGGGRWYQPQLLCWANQIRLLSAVHVALFAVAPQNPKSTYQPGCSA